MIATARLFFPFSEVLWVVRHVADVHFCLGWRCLYFSTTSSGFESLISHLRGKNIAKAVLMCLFYLCTFIWALAVVSKANVAPRPPILHSQSTVTCFLSLLPVNSVNV